MKEDIKDLAATFIIVFFLVTIVGIIIWICGWYILVALGLVAAFLAFGWAFERIFLDD